MTAGAFLAARSLAGGTAVAAPAWDALAALAVGLAAGLPVAGLPAWAAAAGFGAGAAWAGFGALAPFAAGAAFGLAGALAAERAFLLSVALTVPVLLALAADAAEVGAVFVRGAFVVGSAPACRADVVGPLAGAVAGFAAAARAGLPSAAFEAPLTTVLLAGEAVFDVPLAAAATDLEDPAAAGPFRPGCLATTLRAGGDVFLADGFAGVVEVEVVAMSFGDLLSRGRVPDDTAGGRREPGPPSLSQSGSRG
ncbi:MAG: hypothetical protein WAL04_06445 [Acidimicrobiales bacterium]